MIRRTSIQFSIKHILVATLFVAFVSWYATTANKWVLDGTWALGAIIGAWKQHAKCSRFVFRAGLGGGIAMLAVSPFVLMNEIRDAHNSYPISSISDSFEFYLFGGLILFVIGFVGAAVVPLVAWPFILMARRWMKFVNHITRPMDCE